jgi:twitching motility protein PilT
MMLVRQNLVTYQEALRQASNPDDFALRFQGVSSTSDAKWDDFDQKPGETRAVPGSAAYVQQMRGSGGQPPMPGLRPSQPPAPQRPVLTPSQPAAAAPKPAASTPKPEEEFQIERF